jgi:nanoRNase/pAp phosphatase (c-di-AMP/oligoRNAs hydrolase)
VDLAIISTYEHAVGLWRMSLRSARDDVDVAAIARQLGGGGHRRASGFQHLGAAIAEVLMPEAPVLAERREAMAVLVEGLPRWTRGKAE